jgi:hypothetical protein
MEDIIKTLRQELLEYNQRLSEQEEEIERLKRNVNELSHMTGYDPRDLYDSFGDEEWNTEFGILGIRN